MRHSYGEFLSTNVFFCNMNIWWFIVIIFVEIIFIQCFAMRITFHGEIVNFIVPVVFD